MWHRRIATGGVDGELVLHGFDGTQLTRMVNRRTHRGGVTAISTISASCVVSVGTDCAAYCTECSDSALTSRLLYRAGLPLRHVSATGGWIAVAGDEQKIIVLQPDGTAVWTSETMKHRVCGVHLGPDHLVEPLD